MRINKKGRIAHLLNITAISILFSAVFLYLGYLTGITINEPHPLIPTIAFGFLYCFILMLLYSGIEYTVTSIYNYINNGNSEGYITSLISTPYINYMKRKYPVNNKRKESVDRDYKEAIEELNNYLGI